MAKKNTMKEDVYNVKDEKGNVVATLKYGEGSQMYNEAKAARETGGTYQVYESQGHDPELYPSVSSAKVDVSLDAKNGKITLTGPKWLTSEFKNSDSFKQVVSQNKALSKLINLYQQDPNSKVSMKDGTTTTVTEALKEFEDAANELGSVYGQNIAAKDRIANAYGTSLDDKQLSIAYSGQIKDSDTYDKKASVYIPKWAEGMYNWSSLESYDPDSRTVSADDFFKNVYEGKFSEEGSIDRIKELRKSSEEHMREFLDNNTYDRSNSETSRQKEEEFGSDEYKDEFARTRAFYTYITQNSPDASGALKTAFWASSFVNTFTKEFSKMGFNLSEDLVKLFESSSTAYGVFDNNAVSDTLTVISPSYWGAVKLGELYIFIGQGGQLEEFETNLIESIEKLKSDGQWHGFGDLLELQKQKPLADYEAQDFEMRGGTKADELLKEYANFGGLGGNAAKNGAFWGHMAYKIVENMALLNPVGQGADKILAGTASPVAKFIAKFMPETACKALGFAANVSIQGLLETYIDDRDLVDAAFAQGELTSELISAIERNTMWNAVGEASPLFYNNVIVKTTPGKMLDMGLKKMGAGVGLAKNKAIKPFFTWLNKFKTADAAGGIAESTGKTVAQYTTEYFDALAKAQKAILSMPIMKDLTEEQKQIVKDATAFILTGKTVAELEKNGEDFQKGLINEMFKKADALKSGVGQNYEYMNKVILSRMNLENNFDAILRGDRAKLEQMNAFSGKNFEEYTSSLTKTLEMEQRAIKKGAKLTARDVGSLMSKESAEFLSYQTQLGRYEAQLAAGKFTKASDAKQAEAYVDFMKTRLAELRNVLGNDLVAQLESHLTAMGRYYKSLQDYMIAKGYFSDEVKNLISELRKEGAGWGKDGERYIPTARLFGNNEYRVDVKALLDDVSSGSLLKGKTYSDDLKQYKIGGSEDSFMDPTMVLYAHARQMAKTAQGVDMWRALRANNLLSRSIKSFDEEGFTKFETDLMAKTAKGMEKDFKSIFDAKGKEVLSATREAFTTGNALKEGYESAQAVTIYKQMANQVDKDLTLSAKRALITDAPAEDIDAVLANAPSYMDIPQFSVDGVNAANFKEWYDSFPEGVQNRLAKALGDRKLNVTNVKALYKENPEIELDLKRVYIQSSGKDSYRIWDSASNKSYIRERAVASLNAEGNTLQPEIAAQYRKAKEALDGKPFKIADPSTYNAEFTAQIAKTTEDVKNALAEAIKKNPDTAGSFSDMVSRLTKTGLVSEEQAEAYAVYYHLNKLKVDDIQKALRSTGNNLTSSADKAARAAKIPRNQQEIVDKVTNAVARGIKSRITSEFNQLQNLVKSAGAGDAMDLDLYWKEIKKLEGEIYEAGGKWLKAEDQAVMDRHIVQAVNGEGELQYYEVDPSTAFLVNARPNYSKEGANKIADIATMLNSSANQIFRLGTTGMDRISYINQWFRDIINAIIVGGARPFIDLGTGGIKSALASSAVDYIPFGQKIFGKAVTEKIGSEVVESTYKAAREGLEMELGSDFVKGIEDEAASGLEGAAATAAKKRAVVDYTIRRSGYEALPSSGMREAEVYRTTTAKGTGKAKTEAEIRAEEFDNIIDGGDKMAQFNRKMKKMKSKIDDLMSDELSKGSWRETFLRKSVFTSQYNLAIKSGMTSQEAQIWASRYAMDATTNFGRPFAFGNTFMRNVPYLGAAINGAKSFYRLLELDPVGVSSRLTFGLILPYMMELSESLSDPKARELYAQVPEYEKEDSLVFFFRGSMVKIPAPQELSAFLSPFRHMIEKSAGVNDASWLSLVTSDALGILPLDLSGFADLDANDILAEKDSKTPFWSHISRGLEKAGSSLMGPVVKSAYMFVSGRDPYTGREIDRSYKTTDDEGNTVVMDSTQSELAQMMKNKGIFKDMSASSTYAVLKALMGRSTISVLDEGISLFSGQAVDEEGNFRKNTKGEWLEEHFNEFGEQVLKPIGVSEPNYGAEIEWRTAVNKLYDARQALVNDEGFNSVYRTLQSQSASEEKKAGALASYREMLDTYSKQVLTAAKNLQAKYPDAYTRTREAQVVSLLTLPTGLTYNDTAYAADLRNEEYYDAKAQAVATYVKMGFPDTNPSDTMLGRGYFDSQGQYQFKVYTPYEIQFMQDGVFGMAAEVSAQIDQVMAANKIKSGDMWDLYHSTSDKALRKKIMGQWNAKVVPLIAPIVEKYGADAVLGNSTTRDTMTKYIYTDNPYKKKEYLYRIFGEEQ